MNDREQGFTDYFASRSGALRGTAYLLCGDWHRAEDLVQTAFVKLYRAWNRVTAHDTIDAYTRRILVRTYLDENRRGELALRAGHAGDVDQRGGQVGGVGGEVELADHDRHATGMQPRAGVPA